jgi:putative transposase
MLKAIKIRLYLNNEQIIYTNKLFGTNRFIYNNLLSYKINEYKENKKSITFSELGKKLTNLKTEYEWIKESHSKVLQQSIIDMDNAYQSFFKKGKGFPKFKSKHNKQSCRFPIDAIGKIKGNVINIIKPLSNIHFKCSRSDESYLNKNKKLIKSATLSKTKTGKYYLSILIDKDNKVLEKPKNESIGIDLGIKDFIVTSEKTRYDNIKIKRNNKKKLKKLNQRLSKKQKGSKNKEKARIKLAKFHEKLNNQKEHYLHNIANSLINDNQVIVMEDLNVKGMMKNHNLAKSIQELSLNRFKNIMEYKIKWYGRELIFVDRFFPSSKLCSCCGTKNNELLLKDREWECSSCGTIHDRDYNASINILNEGLKLYKDKIGLSSPK